MESEKVKEIKKVLEQNAKTCLLYDFEKNAECKVFQCKYILDYINELESENERIKNIGLNEDITVREWLQENQELKDRIALLEKDNELLRNAKVVYETVDYCYEDLKKAEKRIAELEKEIKENAFYAKGYAQGIKNTYEVVMPDKLKQFAERLKEKCKERYMLLHSHTCYGDIEFEIDETLKEFKKNESSM